MKVWVVTKHGHDTVTAEVLGVYRGKEVAKIAALDDCGDIDALPWLVTGDDREVTSSYNSDRYVVEGFDLDGSDDQS